MEKGQSFFDLFMERQPLYEGYADMEIGCNRMSQEDAAFLIAETIKRFPVNKKPAQEIKLV